MIKCAVYVRVSTRDQSLVQQFRDVRAAVEGRGWKITRVYRERRTAKHGARRPQWEALKADAASVPRQFSAVAVWSLDRMGRSIIDCLNAVQGFDENKTKLVVVKQNIDTSTAAGKAFRNMLLVFAEFERDIISERTLAGLAAARRKGRVGGRPKAKVTARDLRAIEKGTSSVAATARRLKISESTVRNKLKER